MGTLTIGDGRRQITEHFLRVKLLQRRMLLNVSQQIAFFTVFQTSFSGLTGRRAVLQLFLVSRRRSDEKLVKLFELDLS